MTEKITDFYSNHKDAIHTTLRISGCAAVGAIALPATVCTLTGVSALGIVAGGNFAALQSAGNAASWGFADGGIVAGSAAAMLQSAMATGALTALGAKIGGLSGLAYEGLSRLRR